MAVKTIKVAANPNYSEGNASISSSSSPRLTYQWNLASEISNASQIQAWYISFYFQHGRGSIYCKPRNGISDIPEIGYATGGDQLIQFTQLPTTLSGTVTLDFRVAANSSDWGRITQTFLYFQVDDASSDPSTDLEPSTVTVTNATAYSSSVTGQPCRVTFSNPNIESVMHSIQFKVENTATGSNHNWSTSARYGYSLDIPEDWFDIFPNTSVTGGQVNYATVTTSGLPVGGWNTAIFTLSLDLNSPTARPDAPGVSVTISTDNETIRGWNVPVQNYSYANLAINTPAAKYNTTIRFYEIQGPDFSQQIACTGTTENSVTNFQTPVFTTPGEYTIQVRAVDARGLRSEWQTYTVNVLTYTKPLISSCRIVRCERDGTESESGTHAKITCVASYSHVGPNYVRGVGAAYCVTGSNAFSSEVTLTSNGDVYTGIIGIDPESTTDGLLNPSSSYDVRITINDMLVGAAFYYTLNTESFTFHMMDGGEGVAFGKASEKAGYLELAADWSIWMDKYNKDIIDLIVPIGSIKIFTDNTDPNVLYGGTKWTKLKDRFLLGSGDTYTLGDTGGSAEIPAHTHDITYTLSPGGGTDYAYYVTTTNQATSSTTGGVTGISGSAKNLPPYLVVNIWKRIY